MISEETVTHVAKLARLELTPQEVSQYTQDLSNILALVDQLSALDLDRMESGLNSEQETLFRADEPRHPIERQVLMANAPHEENGFFRVPKILES